MMSTLTEEEQFDPATWPRVDGARYLCTLSRPMPKGAPGEWVHQDTADAGTCSDGCCDRHECRGCGKRFYVEGAD